MKVRFGLAVFVLIMVAAPVFAQEAAMAPKGMSDVRNLEAGFPTQSVDTMTVPQGKFGFGLSMGYLNAKGGGIDDVLGPVVPAVNYGILPNLQLMFTMPLTIGEGKINGGNLIYGNTTYSANLDTDWGFMWRINEETEYLPSFGLELSTKAPTGYGATGWNGTALGVASKTFGQLRTFVNAAITTIGKDLGGQNHVDSYLLGADYPVMDNMDLIVDVFTSQSTFSSLDEQRINVAEVGARYALSDCDTVSAGVGLGFGPGAATPDFTVTVAYERAM